MQPTYMTQSNTHDPFLEEPSSIIIDNQMTGNTNNLTVFERKKSKEPKQENPPR
jgi:hypothetical protein